MLVELSVMEQRYLKVLSSLLPWQVDDAVAALVCELRRAHPRWVRGGCGTTWGCGVWCGCRHGPRCIGCWCVRIWLRAGPVLAWPTPVAT